MTERIGLFPAAGSATRLGLMGSSKEVLSVVDVSCAEHAFCPVGNYLLNQYSEAGVSKTLVLTREDKRDIVETFGFQFGDNLSMDYQICPRTPSVVHTIDAASPHLHDSDVALGFPDIIMHEHHVFDSLFKRLGSTDVAVVLGLFPTTRPEKFDLVKTNDNQDVLQIEIKNAKCKWRDTWVCAVWSTEFTHFLHAWVSRHSAAQEPHVGHVLKAAIDAGLGVSSVRFPKGQILDVGTPEDLALARDHARLVKFLKIHSVI